MTVKYRRLQTVPVFIQTKRSERSLSKKVTKFVLTIFELGLEYFVPTNIIELHCDKSLLITMRYNDGRQGVARFQDLAAQRPNTRYWGSNGGEVGRFTIYVENGRREIY